MHKYFFSSENCNSFCSYAQSKLDAVICQLKKESLPPYILPILTKFLSKLNPYIIEVIKIFINKNFIKTVIKTVVLTISIFSKAFKNNKISKCCFKIMQNTFYLKYGSNTDVTITHTNKFNICSILYRWKCWLMTFRKIIFQSIEIFKS